MSENREGVPVKDVADSSLEDSYDTICIMSVLELIPDAKGFVKALLPHCQNQLLIATSNLGYIDHRVRLGLFGRMPLTNVWYDIREQVRFWTVEDFRTWAKATGLSLVGIQGTQTSFMRRRFPSLLSVQIVYDLRVPSPR